MLRWWEAAAPVAATRISAAKRATDATALQPDGVVLPTLAAWRRPLTRAPRPVWGRNNRIDSRGCT